MRFLLWDVTVRYIGFTKTLDALLMERINSGLMVDAIKLHRNKTGSTLKDSRDYCFALKDAHK